MALALADTFLLEVGPLASDDVALTGSPLPRRAVGLRSDGGGLIARWRRPSKAPAARRLPPAPMRDFERDGDDDTAEAIDPEIAVRDLVGAGG